jgi:hypothetical protein
MREISRAEGKARARDLAVFTELLTPMNNRQALEAVIRPCRGIIAPELGEEIVRVQGRSTGAADV